MYHFFDVGVAVKYGINAAVIFQNIAFWCEHSRANERNFHDGHYWTYNSVKAFQDLFPYLGKSQISAAIQKLVDDGLIIKGSYNKVAYDRTAWYAVTETGYSMIRKSENALSENQTLDLPKNGNGFTENRKPIPDINPDIKPDILPDGFEEFWDIYPRHLDKQKAIRAWKALKPDKDLIDTILDDVRKRNSVNWNVRSTDYVPYPTSYLNGRRWEDDPVSNFDSEPEVIERDLSVEEIMRRAAGLPPEGS